MQLCEMQSEFKRKKIFYTENLSNWNKFKEWSKKIISYCKILLILIMLDISSIAFYTQCVMLV